MAKSVLQDWVMELPLREQGTLLTCVRGCDVQPKLPLDSNARQLVGWLRWAFMTPHDIREVGIPGAFFQNQCPQFRASEFGHLPLHWYSHVMHAAEVIAYRHPESDYRVQAMTIYMTLVRGLHLYSELSSEMIQRLSEDRIASGEVVS